MKSGKKKIQDYYLWLLNLFRFTISDESQSSTAEEQPITYPLIDDKTDHIQSLKSNNKALHGYLGTLIKNNEVLVSNNQKLVDAQLLLINRGMKEPNEEA